jgi:hypothetical protein
MKKMLVLMVALLFSTNLWANDTRFCNVDNLVFSQAPSENYVNLASNEDKGNYPQGIKLAQRTDTQQSRSRTVDSDVINRVTTAAQGRFSVRAGNPLASLAGSVLPEEIKCNGSCLCKGAGDCVNMTLSGCCSGVITCNDSGCSCVNGGGCDQDGNL